jgi:hypothetical protein
MKTLLRLACLVTALAAPLHAIPNEMALSASGSGTVEIGGSIDRVSKANIVLRPDGKFSIGLVGGDDTRFGGTWSNGSNDMVYLRLREADGRDARGSGEIALQGRRGGYDLDRLSIAGENDKGKSVRVRFSTPRYVPAPPPPPVQRFVLDSDRTGFGRLQISGRDGYRISWMRVQLYSDGRASVRAEGTTALRYEGTWTNNGSGVATLALRGGLDSERMNGIVRWRYGRLSQVELSGTRLSRYHSLEFQAGR